MTTLKLAQTALLAESSYGYFQDATPIPQEIRRALFEEDISQSQVDDLQQTFTLLHHLSNRDSGFSATLFQNTGAVANAKFTLSVRGTEPLAQAGVDVISADLEGIVVEGAALYQIVDLYNYWKQLTASAGASVRLARIAETTDPLASGLFAAVTRPGEPTNFRRIEFFDQTGVGLGVVTGPITNVTVTGHSLGGHLATAFQRLFPAVVGEVYTVNGAGTRDSDTISRFFDVLAGRPTSFDATKVTNLFGSAGPNVVSGELVYAQIGERTEIYTESISDVGGHGGKQMTDSAAVYDLFIRADDRFKTQPASQLSASLMDVFKAADAQAAFSLESVVNVFGRVLVPGYAPIVRASADDRDGLHSRINAIRALLPASGNGLAIELLAGKTAADLVNLAQTDVAYRYALRELDPFAIVGADYSRHTAGGSLDFYDAATGRGLTGEWLDARARFLQAAIDYNMADANVDANAIGAHFEDRARGIAFGPLNATTARVVFGRDDQALTATGSAMDDSLVGAGADDGLSGAAGNDYLEGGAGADTLDGGPGNDRLFGNNGDDTLIAGGGLDELNGGGGFDRYEVEADAGIAVVRDSDGLGTLVVGGTPVEGTFRRSGNIYQSGDGELIVSFIGDPDISGTLIVGDAVRIEGFHNGDLGIVLDAAAPDTLPVAAYAYSLDAWPDNIPDEDPDGLPLAFGSDGNDIFRPGPGSRLGLDGSFRGLGGDDQYFGLESAGETFFGDAGDDLIDGAAVADAFAGTPGDTLVGGGGNDRISGGGKDDVLFGDIRHLAATADGLTAKLDEATILPLAGTDSQADISLPLLSHEQTIIDTEPGYAVRDALAYLLGTGVDDYAPSGFDDVLDGRGGNDVIEGGNGSDILYGGAGDDTLYGDYNFSHNRDLAAEYLPLLGRPGDDELHGGDGNDQLNDLSGGNDALYGDAGDDVLNNTDPAEVPGYAELASFANVLDGGEGNDTLFSQNESAWAFDYLDGGVGNDTLTVNNAQSPGGGHVFVLGGDGADEIHVASFAGYVDGGAGNDSIDVSGVEDDFEDGALRGAGGVDIFGGLGDDNIVSLGPNNIDGGAGADTIEWQATDGQIVAGFIRGGTEDDSITVFGAADIDGGSGNDTIRVFAGAGHIHPGEGRDRILVEVYDGAVSHLVIDTGAAGAANADQLVFERFSGDGVPLQSGQPDLRMQRTGNDLQLDLFNVAAGGAETARASVRVLGWFRNGANPLETISVEGLRSWTPDDVAALIPDNILVAASDTPPDSTPVADTPDTPATADVTTIAVQAPAVPELAAESADTPSVSPAGGVTTGESSATTQGVSASVENADLPRRAATEDPVEAFLDRLRENRERNFSFTRALVDVGPAREAANETSVSRPDRIAGQWSALHAYMDALATEADLDQTTAVPQERVLGRSVAGVFASDGMTPPGMAPIASMGISDSSAGSLRPLQGLSEGIALLA